MTKKKFYIASSMKNIKAARFLADVLEGTLKGWECGASWITADESQDTEWDWVRRDIMDMRQSTCFYFPEFSLYICWQMV